MARKGQFKKGGGRVGQTASAPRKRKSTAITKVHHKYVTHKRKAPSTGRRRRRASGGGGVMDSVLKVAAAGAVLGFLTSDNNGAGKTVTEWVNKVPGSKTFGPDAVLGAGCLLADRFLYKSKWLRVAGFIGIGLAAVKVGRQNTDMKWLGEEEDGDTIADVE